MNSATASMDFTSLVEDTLQKHRNEWLAHYRLQRGLIGAALPFKEDAALDSARWSAKTFKKAVEWATFNPMDLARLVWWSLRSFLQRVGTFFGVRLIAADDSSGQKYVAS